jgi:hypothetical protein
MKHSSAPHKIRKNYQLSNFPLLRFPIRLRYRDFRCAPTSVSLTILLLFTLTATNCGKDPVEKEISKLPPYTEEGKNTFGCLVDGKAWIPKGRFYSTGASAVSTTYDSRRNYLSIVARKYGEKDEDYTGFSIEIYEKVWGIGEYDLFDPKRTLGPVRYSTYDKSYILDSSHTGKLQIKYLDSINRHISGTFYFNAIDKSSGAVVKISDGRFDLYYTY